GAGEGGVRGAGLAARSAQPRLQRFAAQWRDPDRISGRYSDPARAAVAPRDAAAASTGAPVAAAPAAECCRAEPARNAADSRGCRARIAGRKTEPDAGRG